MNGDAYKLGRKCHCGQPIVDRCKSGLCRKHYMERLNSDPSRGVKIGASVRKRFEDPAFKAKHAEAARRGGMTKRANPELRERMSRNMRENIQPISVATGANTRRDYAAMIKLAVEARWAWCPPEYREMYRAIRAKDIPMAEARRMIAEEIARDLAKLSPFERQMKALQNGAKLVANDIKPSLANPGVYRVEDAA